MSISIIKPGLHTTIQDSGRFGYQKEGMAVSGAMDGAALRIGNILVGNDEKEAGIEITQLGPGILFEESCLIAITGADLSPVINQTAIPLWRPVYVNRGSLLEFGKPRTGYIGYITFAGGLDVREVMGSRSTFVRAGTGGWKGRSLQKGDVIPFQQLVRSRILAEEINPLKRTFVTARWTSHPALLPVYEKDPVVRIIKGPEYELFTEESKHYLWKSSFRISPQSDRMGYRLQGNSLRMETSAEMLSTAVTFGTIQVPANGNPIILMADHQTTGGYPRIGQVASADFSRLAQAPPGSWISFKEISIKEAQQLYIQQEKYMNRLKSAVNLKARGSMLQ